MCLVRGDVSALLSTLQSSSPRKVFPDSDIKTTCNLLGCWCSADTPSSSPVASFVQVLTLARKKRRGPRRRRWSWSKWKKNERGELTRVSMWRGGSNLLFCKAAWRLFSSPTPRLALGEKKQIVTIIHFRLASPRGEINVSAGRMPVVVYRRGVPSPWRASSAFKLFMIPLMVLTARLVDVRCLWYCYRTMQETGKAIACCTNCAHCKRRAPW